jgi:hypothetical protein
MSRPTAKARESKRIASKGMSKRIPEKLDAQNDAFFSKVHVVHVD